MGQYKPQFKLFFFIYYIIFSYINTEQGLEGKREKVAVGWVERSETQHPRELGSGGVREWGSGQRLLLKYWRYNSQLTMTLFPCS